MRALIFDSSSIITLALNNLLNLLIPLKKAFRGKFLIPKSVKEEIIDKPIKIKRFRLEALMISNLLKMSVLEVGDLPEHKTREVIELANHTYKAEGEFIRLVHEGEASCLGLYKLLKEQGHNVALVIDERTTRMLCEAPINLQKLLEKKLHTNVKIERKNLDFFKDFDIIRSSELCLVALKKGLISLPAPLPKAVDALLYATKYKGCAISVTEIEKVKEYSKELI